MTGQERFFFSYCRRARHPEHVPAALLHPGDEGGRRAQDARALGAARAPHRGGGHPRLSRRQEPGVRGSGRGRRRAPSASPRATTRTVAAAAAHRPARDVSSMRARSAPTPDRHRHHRVVVVLEQEVEEDVGAAHHDQDPRPGPEDARAPSEGRSRPSPSSPASGTEQRSVAVGELSAAGGRGACSTGVASPAPSRRRSFGTDWLRNGHVQCT